MIINKFEEKLKSMIYNMKKTDYGTYLYTFKINATYDLLEISEIILHLKRRDGCFVLKEPYHSLPKELAREKTTIREHYE